MANPRVASPDDPTGKSGRPPESRRPGHSVQQAMLCGQVRSAWGSEQKLKDYDEAEAVLRALGLNRRERERVRRGPRSHRTRDTARDEARALKRISFYFEQRVGVDEMPSETSRAEAVAAWGRLSRYDVDKVNEWWSKGAHPLDYRELERLTEKGLDFEDLFVEIHGKAIAQHVREGSTADWCLLALDWASR